MRRPEPEIMGQSSSPGHRRLKYTRLDAASSFLAPQNFEALVFQSIEA
jgi:hypothetical protein